jgi:YHS domain-containing protein
MKSKTSLALGLALLVLMTWSVPAQVQPDTAVDPVCGMTVKKSTAKYTFDYKGATYYFCSEGCKTSFSKEPEKYLSKTAEAKPAMMGQGMGMGMMRGQTGMGTEHVDCLFMLADVEKKFENTQDGVIITLSSKNPETVKAIQDRAAAMKDGMCPMMGKDESSKTGTRGSCPMGANCPNKKK